MGINLFRWLGLAWILAILPVSVGLSLSAYGLAAPLYLVGGTLSGLVWQSILVGPWLLIGGFVVWGVDYVLQYQSPRASRQWLIPLAVVLTALPISRSGGWLFGIVSGVGAFVATYLELGQAMPTGRRWLLVLAAILVMSLFVYVGLGGSV